MPKIIIDEDAMKLAHSKLINQPIYSQLSRDCLNSKVIDILDHENTQGKWQPGNKEAQFLLLCVEACKAIVFQAQLFKNEEFRDRSIRAMTVPLCSLMDETHKLTNSLDKDEESRKERRQWSPDNQKTYKNIGKKFRKKRISGPVREIRNKVAAHLDREIINRKYQLALEDFLFALGDTLILLMLSTNHRNKFSWIRWISSSQDNTIHIVETLFEYPLCVRWTTNSEGKPVDVGYPQLVDDPQKYVRDQVAEAIKIFNEMVTISQSSVPTIWVS